MAPDGLSEARRILLDALPMAARRLVEIVRDGDDRVAISAISALMDRAGLVKGAEEGEPGPAGSPLEEVLARLAEVEVRLAGDGAQPG